MKASTRGFRYDWADLQPIRALALVVCAGQALGAVAGLLWAHAPPGLDVLWHGAALATLPAFLVGLAVQAGLRPGSLRENKALVCRFALVAVLLSGYAFTH